MALTAADAATHPESPSRSSFISRLNTAWHERALQTFMVIVLAHWAEHLAQATQVYILGWPNAEARGVLGLWFPWLVKSESLHYAYAIVMLVGIWILRPGFVGTSKIWWNLALGIQFWHHIEHALLQGQAIAGQNLFNSPVPVSIAQLWIPRLELHLIYNAIVFIPMVIGMYYHMFPPKGQEEHMRCTCAWHPRVATA